MVYMNYWLTWLNMPEGEEKDELMLKISSNRSIYKLFVEQAEQWKASKSVKIYKYFITFTTRPETRNGSLEFLESQAAREQLGIIYFAYTFENENENLHYHVILHTNKPIEKASFKHWQKHRGFVDFRPIKPGTEGNVKAYGLKENQIKTLVVNGELLN